MDFLQSLFAQADRLQAHLSEEWREHVNRRTLAAFIVCAALFALAYLYLIRPPDDFPTAQLVSVPAGESLDTVAQTLYEDGVIRNPLVFRLIVTAMGHEHGVIAGDYEFKQPVSVFYVARALSIGEFGLVPIRIRISEGATMAQMAQLYSAELPRFNSVSFLEQTATDEGYLFPDTYFFLPNATEQTVIESMRQDFDQQVASIEPDIASSTHSPADIVTMASIVEDEASNTQDRQMIAGILWRRIAQGLPLQADPTLVYAFQVPDSQLTIQDLQSTSTYNTYVHKGLPPTPIGSPSLNSIEAAAGATTSPYLYYLADRSGVTHYCKTFTCQAANERRYLGE